MKFVNIIWGVDGTLFDTYPAITYAISKSLNKMGISIALNVIDGLARQSLDRCMETISQRFKLNPDLLQQRFATSYRTVDPANQPPFPGAREVCELIHARGGLNLIITHRKVQSTQRLLDAHNMTPYFDGIYSVEQGYPRKPDPTMALAVLENHAIVATETLMVGDHDLDIQVGRAAGVRTCLFGQVKLTTPADIQIEHYTQLLQMLKNEKLSK
jgi:HAD superfamily hydrolase (TIGR01549 family)